jgi:hypothetical protein
VMIYYTDPEHHAQALRARDELADVIVKQMLKKPSIEFRAMQKKKML